MQKNLLKQLLLALAVGAFVFGASAEAQTRRTKRKPPKQIAEQTTGKVIYEPDADLLKLLRGQISVVESEQSWTTLDRRTALVNPSKTMTAYVAQFRIDNSSDAALIDMVVVESKQAGEFFEIRGFDFPRPFESLKWISSDVLQFDQWVNGSNGGRYQINLKTGKMVAAGYLRSN